MGGCVHIAVFIHFRLILGYGEADRRSLDCTYDDWEVESVKRMHVTGETLVSEGMSEARQFYFLLYLT